MHHQDIRKLRHKSDSSIWEAVYYAYIIHSKISMIIQDKIWNKSDN
jgi:hypothetical protein